MRKKLIINSLSGGAMLLIGTILVLIVVPIFIGHLGIEKYGVFSLILITNNFSVFLGLGLNTSLLKFLSEQGKSRESNLDILVALIFSGLTYVAYAIACFIYNEPILRMLGVPGRFITPDTLLFFNLLITANFFAFINQVPVSILDSLQKIYLTNFLQTLFQIVYWLLIIISIFLYGSMGMIGMAILISNIFWFTLLYFSTRKYWGSLRIYPDKREFIINVKKQFSYSYKLFLGNIINFFYEPLSKVLISTFIGVAEVGYFDIILRIRTQIWNTLTKLLYPLFPFISQLKDKVSIRNLIHNIEQKLTYVVLFFISVVIFIAPDFIQVWLKTENNLVSTGMIIVIAGNLISVIIIPMYQFLVLKGYPEKTIILQGINVLVNLIVFFGLYKSLGFFAIIWSHTIALLTSFIIILYYQRKYINSLIFDNFIQFLKASSLFILLLSSGYLIDLLIDSSMLEIFILPSVSLLLTLLFIRYLRVISLDDILKYSGENLFVRNILLKVFPPAERNSI